MASRSLSKRFGNLFAEHQEHYTVQYHEFGGVWRPIVFAVFSFGDSMREYRTPMLVDTGADNIVVPDAVRDMLGIGLEICEKGWANSLSGRVRTYRSPEVHFCLDDLRDDLKFPCHVQFIEAPQQYGLLGREALDQISFGFSRRDGYTFVVGFPSGD